VTAQGEDWPAMNVIEDKILSALREAPEPLTIVDLIAAADSRRNPVPVMYAVEQILWRGGIEVADTIQVRGVKARRFRLVDTDG
jgi:hypothetical protein